MIVIIDSGGSNISSIQFALKRLQCNGLLTTDIEKIKSASHIILPGVGHASDAMNKLNDAGLVKTIRLLKQPVLGICLGMQLLFEYSEEGCVPCLNVIPGVIRKLTANPSIHMGWNTLNILQNNILTRQITGGEYSYFVHGYCASVSKYTLATTFYQNEFTAIVQRDNFYGTQFHPERSGSVGNTILRNFLELI